MTTKSFSYDDANYRTSDGVAFNIAAGSGANSQKFCTFTGRQLKSVELVQTTSGTSSDILSFVVKTTGSGTLGTATYTAGSAGTYTTITVNSLATFGSGSTAAQNVALSGGTFVVTVAQGGGTSTTTATATIGSGATGGLTIVQGDQFYVVKGTDATAAYAGEIEFQFTPQTTYTV